MKKQYYIVTVLICIAVALFVIQNHHPDPSQKDIVLQKYGDSNKTTYIMDQEIWVYSNKIPEAYWEVRFQNEHFQSIKVFKSDNTLVFEENDIRKLPTIRNIKELVRAKDPNDPSKENPDFTVLTVARPLPFVTLYHL